MYTFEALINKAREIHGNKYSYDESTYIKVSEPLRIVCPEHGEFWQSFHAHINKKQGCPVCGVKKRSESKSYDFDDFLKKAKEVHGEKYIYNENDYNGYKKKMKMICPIHGEFYQAPTYHINNRYGCPECGMDIARNIKRKSVNDFINIAKKIHNNKYDYSKVNYVNAITKVCIICPEHGEFWQIPYSHLKGFGCQKCGDALRGKNQTKTQEQFISEANIIHSNKYDYTKTKYTGIYNPVIITCPKHGDFEQVPSYHLQGNGCPTCGKVISNAETEIFNFVSQYIGEENVQQRNRILIAPQELDIYVRPIKYAIEYNGLRWHSEKFGKDKWYHLNKLNACKKRGIKLIQIFEDEYVNHRDIVYAKLKHILKLNANQPKIAGRKCTIVEITNKEAKQFLEQYHIQGYTRSSIHIGAYYNGILVGVMSFKQEFKDSNKWELTRYASDYNYTCQGVGGKLFNYFVRNYKPTEVKSFADRRWTTDEENNIYIKLGFEFNSYTNPDYHYFKESDGLIRQHKFGFRKNRLNKEYGLPLTMTENEMTESLGYSKIYDCGLIKYIWHQN